MAKKDGVAEAFRRELEKATGSSVDLIDSRKKSSSLHVLVVSDAFTDMSLKDRSRLHSRACRSIDLMGMHVIPTLMGRAEYGNLSKEGQSR